MFKFLDYFKDNRKKVIIVIACVLLIIYAIKTYFDYKEKDEYNESNSSSSNNTTAIVKNNDIANTNDNNINQTENIVKIESENEAVEKFVNYCNNYNIETAYNMLTDECKKLLYTNKEDFENKYVKSLFDKKRTYQIEKVLQSSSTDNVYKLILSEDPINKGKVDESNNKIDYITIVNTNGTYKLNISGFIKSESINSSNQNTYMQISVSSKLIFVDYEIYNITAKNNILVDAVLDNMENNIKTYIEDEDGNKFRIINDEYTAETTRVQNGKEASFSLKFDRKYSSNNKEIKKIVFSRINIINRNYYQKVFDPENKTTSYKEQMSTYPKYLSLEVEL